MTKNSADAADLLRSVMKCGRYTLAAEESVLERKAAERVARLDRGKARAEMNKTGNAGRGGMRDFFLPANTKHYLRKIAQAQVLDAEDIAAIRVHQVPRTRTMTRAEVKRKDMLFRDSGLLLYRERKVDSGGNVKLGPLQHEWFSFKAPVTKEDEWVGATVFLQKDTESEGQE